MLIARPSLLHSGLALLLACSLHPAALAADKKVSKKPAKTTSSTPSQQQENVHFEQWKEVEVFISQMVNLHGFEEEKLRQLFSQVRHVESAKQLMKPAPPGKPKNWKVYRSRFVEPYRIEAGVRFWNQYTEALERAERQYGVPAEIIVGLIGVETIFGKHTGSFRVLDALTTLAFDYPDTPTRATRMQYFRDELMHMLLIARESQVDPFAFKGSYAGAIGWPQFMPGSIRKYAVDFDGDGRINLTNSPIDAIGSVAHYLAEHGWKPGIPVTFPATLISDDKEALRTVLSQGLRASYTYQELSKLASSASADLAPQLKVGLIDLQNGEEATEYWIATDNFYAITQYNRSYFYAMSVIDLGRVIRQAREQL